MDGVREVRDINGTTILETRRTLTISATGAVPTKRQSVAVGFTADQVTDNTVGHSIVEVRPLAPAGTALRSRYGGVIATTVPPSRRVQLN